MAASTPDPSMWLAQYEGLDSQYRSLKRMVIYLAVFTAVLILFLVGAVLRLQNGAAESKEFVLRDEGGKKRAWLGVVQGTPGLEFYDEAGKVTAGLKLAKEERGFVLFDENHKLRGMLGLVQGRPSLILYDADGKPRANLTEDKDGVGLILRDGNEKPRAGLIVDKNEPRLILKDDKGKDVLPKP